MKFPLHLVLTASCLPLSASGYLPPHTTTTTLLLHRSSRRRNDSTRLHYKEPSSSSGGKPGSFSSSSSDGPSGSSDASNVWSVLADTERWISETLERSNRAANARLDAESERQRQQQQQEKEEKPMHFADEKQPERRRPMPRADNPYARKEVSYACETAGDAAAVAGGVFRRVREARELGESHGRGVEARSGDASQPATMRQTNVVVIPNCEELSEFQAFDKLIQAINQARRTSRDFVLKKDEEDGSKDWVVSINCAHLHPGYGIPTPEEQLASLKHEEEEGEVDVNLLAYKESRDAARRSPYPSVIVEVQSTPPPDFGAGREETATPARKEERSGATSEDVRRLEALFGTSAATKTGPVDDPFYDALGEAFGDRQIASRTPLGTAQDWVLENDPAFDGGTSTFVDSETRHVDAAYECVFHNLAMLVAGAAAPSAAAAGKPDRSGRRAYVVLPDFVPASATSFDRFAGQVSNVVGAAPGLAGRATVATFHPEHVDAGTRAPMPIVVITWK